MKCPICDHPVPKQELRCPKCREPLTVWKNLDLYAQQAFAAGLQQLSERKPEAAAEVLLKAVTFAPAQAEYLDAYGRVVGQLGRYQEAAALLEKAYRLAPKPELKSALDKAGQLAEAQSDAGAGQTGGPGRPLLALGGIRLGPEAREDQPGSSDPRASDASWNLAFEIERRWARFTPFAPLLSWLPGSDGAAAAPVSYLHALHAYRQGSDEEARQLFQKAAQQDNRYCDAEVYLVSLANPEDLDRVLDWLGGQGRSKLQIARILRIAASVDTPLRPELVPPLLKRAIPLAGEERDTLCRQLASTCHTLELLKNACSVWEEALAARSSLELLLLLGDARATLEQPDVAEEVYRRALQEYPAAWQPREHLAMVHQQQDPEESLTLLQEALELPQLADKPRAILLRLRINILDRLQRWKDAVRDAEALLGLRPEDEEVRQAAEYFRSRATPAEEPEKAETGAKKGPPQSGSADEAGEEADRDQVEEGDAG